MNESSPPLPLQPVHVRMARADMKASVTTFARICGVSRPTILKIEGADDDVPLIWRSVYDRIVTGIEAAGYQRVPGGVIKKKPR